MSNKKGAVAVGEYMGILVFMFVLLVVFLIFSSCSVLKVGQDIKQSKISKTEVEAIKSINFFLEMDYVDPDDPEFQEDKGKKVHDIIIKKHNNVDFLEGDMFDKMVHDYFSEKYIYTTKIGSPTRKDGTDKWRFLIFPNIETRGIGHQYQSSDFRYGNKVEAYVRMLVPNEDNYEYLELVLHIYE